MIAALLRLIGYCRHREMYREHRELHGHRVMCFVCPCGHVVPVLKRTSAEQMKALPAPSGPSAGPPGDRREECRALHAGFGWQGSAEPPARRSTAGSPLALFD